MSRPFCYLVAMLQNEVCPGVFFCKRTGVATSKFQNKYNKVEIAFCVVQFWSEIKLVITNRTTSNFVITCLISDQIALKSVH